MSSLLYNIKQGFLQIFRNRGMSLASIFSILAMLLILGLFFVITVNINLFTEVVKQDYDQVEVFLLDGTSKAKAEELITQIKAQPGVTDAAYRSKDEALEIMKERWGESGYLLDSLGKNPLPASILISVDSLENAGNIAAYAGSLDGIDDVQYYQETVEKLTKITNFLQIGALIIMGFLVIVSVVVVSNTVKLTVFARAKEIASELTENDITAKAKEIAAVSANVVQHKAVPKPDEVDMQQMSFFDTVKDDDIIKELDGLELSTMTPIDAMNTLYRLQTRLKNRWKENL